MLRAVAQLALSMFQRIKQWSEIKSYVMKLSLELSRLGKRHYYTTEEVTQTAERAGFKTDYLAYAHALFCERKDFRRHYKRTKFRECYEALRGEVSHRYFGVYGTLMGEYYRRSSQSGNP